MGYSHFTCAASAGFPLAVSCSRRAAFTGSACFVICPNSWALNSRAPTSWGTGLHRLPEGKRKRGLAQWAEGLESDFAGQVLGLDTNSLKTWGILYAKHEAKGFNMDVMDSLVASTALVHQLIVVTRNTADFPPDVKTLNPWTA